MRANYSRICIYCGKFVTPHSVSYGLAWLCDCGKWEVLFSIAGEIVYLRNGDEERAMGYIAKIAQILMVK
jgi:hypothetical protein